MTVTQPETVVWLDLLPQVVSLRMTHPSSPPDLNLRNPLPSTLFDSRMYEDLVGEIPRGVPPESFGLSRLTVTTKGNWETPN